MPNHVTNVVTASPEVILGFARDFTPEEITANRKDYAKTQANYQAREGKDWPYPPDDLSGKLVDFAMVVPEPESMFRGGCDDRHPHVVDGVTYQHCWYGWNSENWGTKWNAYDYSVTPQPGDLCEARFDTAWAHPYPVIHALSMKFPDEVIEVAYADEDFGSNVGRYKIKGGQTFEEFFPEYGDESCHLAAEVKYPGQTFDELQAEWTQNEIESTQHSVFCKRIELERGVDNGYKVIRDEGLTVPDDIKAALSTKEQVDAYWEKGNV